MNINTVFTRRLLKLMHDDIRLAFPDVNVSTAASVTGYRNDYFVQIDVAGYPQHNTQVRAYDRYEAKAKAWRKFFDIHAPEQVKRQIEAETETEAFREVAP